MDSFNSTSTTSFGANGLQMHVEPLNTVAALRVSIAGATIYADSFKLNEDISNQAIKTIVKHLSGSCSRKSISIKDADIEKMLKGTLDTAGVAYDDG